MTLHSLMTMPYRRALVALLALFAVATMTTSGVAAAGPTPATEPPVVTGGPHDFDWETGVWHTDVKVLADPLSGNQDWLQFSGTSAVRSLLNGASNVVELDVSGTVGRIRGLNLRLYEPQSTRWSLTFVSMRDGLLTPSVYGGFHDGVGEFYGKDQLNGQPIWVRFLIYKQGPDKARFEQAFSNDNGATWETNWIAVDRRVGG